jgi:hypothetical protein
VKLDVLDEFGRERSQDAGYHQLFFDSEIAAVPVGDVL